MSSATGWFPIVMHTCPNCAYRRPVQYTPSVYPQSFSCERCTQALSDADITAAPAQSSEDAHLSDLFARQLSVSPTFGSSAGAASDFSFSSSPSSTSSSLPSRLQQQHHYPPQQTQGFSSQPQDSTPQAAPATQNNSMDLSPPPPPPSADHRSAIPTYASTHYTHTAHIVSTGNATALMSGGARWWRGAEPYMATGYAALALVRERREAEEAARRSAGHADGGDVEMS